MEFVVADRDERRSVGMSKTGCQAVALLAATAGLCVMPVGAGATTGVVASPGPHVMPLPSHLVSLEQKMQELDVNTESVSLRFSFPGVAARNAVPSMTATGEVSLEPREGIFEFVGPHGERVEERQIGEDLYVRIPGLAKLAGGRRWEAQSAAGLKQAGLGFGLPGEPAGKGMFASLIEELEGASSVVKVGEPTVDGEQTTEFVARLDASTVMNPLSRSEGKVEMRARKAFEKLGLELKVFIEPDGLPVRTELVFGVKKRFETAEANILAVGVPVEVLAPPAAEVITEAELKKRIEVDARRRCPRLQPAGCRLRSQPPS